MFIFTRNHTLIILITIILIIGPEWEKCKSAGEREKSVMRMDGCSQVQDYYKLK